MPLPPPTRHAQHTLPPLAVTRVARRRLLPPCSAAAAKSLVPEDREAGYMGTCAPDAAAPPLVPPPPPPASRASPLPLQSHPLALHCAAEVDARLASRVGRGEGQARPGLAWPVPHPPRDAKRTQTSRRGLAPRSRCAGALAVLARPPLLPFSRSTPASAPGRAPRDAGPQFNDYASVGYTLGVQGELEVGGRQALQAQQAQQACKKCKKPPPPLSR